MMKLFRVSEWRWKWRQFKGLFQRARRGWASHDTWSFDVYLAGVIAGGLRHLAENTHGHPCDFPGGADGWSAWLRDKAEWFAWYEEGAFYCDIKKIEYFNEVVLPDFAKYYGGLWD